MIVLIFLPSGRIEVPGGMRRVRRHLSLATPHPLFLRDLCDSAVILTISILSLFLRIVYPIIFVDSIRSENYSILDIYKILLFKYIFFQFCSLNEDILEISEKLHAYQFLAQIKTFRFNLVDWRAQRRVLLSNG